MFSGREVKETFDKLISLDEKILFIQIKNTALLTLINFV
jgi:hypothetical protein